jgi:hypothetical protein
VRLVVEATVVAAWLGAALLFTLIVAPSAFAVLPSRTLAGALVGRVLPVLFLSGVLLGAAVALSGFIDRDAAGLRRLVTGLVLAISCAASQFVVGGRIARLREAIGPSLEALAPGDARRVLFGRLHALSVAGLGIGMLAAAAALGFALLALRGRA